MKHNIEKIKPMSTVDKSNLIAHVCIVLDAAMADGGFKKIKHPSRVSFEFVYAIAMDKPFYLHSKSKQDQKILELFNKIFEANDTAWNYITKFVEPAKKVKN